MSATDSRSTTAREMKTDSVPRTGPVIISMNYTRNITQCAVI